MANWTCSCSRKTKIETFIGFGITLALTGLICHLFLPSLVQTIVKQRLILSPSSASYDMWKQPPIPIYQQFYLFNVTNLDDVLQLKQPIYEELGPYTFRLHLTKSDINWHPNGTVSYGIRKRWHFVEEKTIGSLDDFVIHLNVPMISAGNEPKRWSDGHDFIYDAINEMTQITNSSLFLKHRVRQLLFEGYNEPLMEIAQQFFEGPAHLDKFGWIYKKNNSISDGIYSIFTGEKDMNKFGLMDTWNQSSMLKQWFGNECARIDESTAGDFMPPYMKRPQTIRLFIGDICRSIPLRYVGEVDVNGVKCNRYWSDASTFDYSIDENKCYCEDGKNCPPNGVANISSCHHGSPTAISFPHFLYADESYSQHIKGMKPDASKHALYVDIEPNLGVPFNMMFRLQINTVFEKDSNLYFASNLTQDKIYYPQMWFSIYAQADDDLSQRVILLQSIVPCAISATAFVLITIGGLLLICAAFILLLTKLTKKSDNHDHRSQKYHAVKLVSTSFT